ncbi:MAG: hypothetical protein K0R99_3999 [Microbacterium sp.]|nr:hypothetical protein [Microbacterium sp.]
MTGRSSRDAWHMWTRHDQDARGFFLWRLPAMSGADVLTDAEIDRLKALPEPALRDLLRRVEVAVVELTSLQRQLANRWVVVRMCPSCGGDVYGRSDKRYCSRACQQRAYVIRKKEVR